MKYINDIKDITIILPMMKSAFTTAKATNTVMQNVYKITLRELMS